MTAPNRKGTHPTPLQGKHSLLSRKAILDGKVKVFYGPQQDPNSGDQPGFDPFTGAVTRKTYRPPVFWPRAGTLLRVPQVCFLASRFFDLFNDTITVPAGYLAWRRAVPPNGSSNIYSEFAHATVPNIALAESDRLRAVFEEVRSRINPIRTNRTWVSDVADDDTMALTADHMLAPPTSETGWFGTDFLRVYAGSGVVTTETALWEASPPDQVDPDPTVNPAWLASLDRLAAAVPRFRRHAARVYGPGLDWHAGDLAPSTFSGWAFFTFDTDPPTLYPEAHLLLDPASPDATLFSPVVALEQKNIRSRAIAKWLEDACAPLGDFDITYEGTTDLITADMLVALIADHFRFDPATGKDL